MYKDDYFISEKSKDHLMNEVESARELYDELIELMDDIIHSNQMDEEKYDKYIKLNDKVWNVLNSLETEILTG